MFWILIPNPGVNLPAPEKRNIGDRTLSGLQENFHPMQAPSIQKVLNVPPDCRTMLWTPASRFGFISKPMK